MRVLLISHTCISPRAGQPKAIALSKYDDLTLRVLIPDRWFEYGKWLGATIADDAPDGLFQVAKVSLPWTGPAQWYLHWYPELRRTLKEFRPDVIDLWEEPWGMVSMQTCRLRNRLLPQSRIIIETEQNINKKLPFPFERFRSYSLKQADFAIGRNRESLDVLRDKGFSGPCEVVPNAVDNTLFQPMDRATSRQRHDVPKDQFVIGYAGRLVEEKGLLDAVDAVAKCSDDVNLLFIGAGPLEQAINEQAAALGITGRVRIVPSVDITELPSWMNAMDVFVLPSRTTPRWKEQFGRVIIEAAACGIPVIGSDSGAIPDVIGDNGLVVPECNPEQLAAAIMRLHDDRELCRRLGSNGHATVQKRYTWERVAERMHEIYETVFRMSGSSSDETA